MQFLPILAGRVRTNVDKMTTGRYLTYPRRLQTPQTANMAKADERARLRAVQEAIDAATLNQTDLAEAAGISRDSLYQYRMAARRPTPDTIRRIVKALKRQRQAIDRAIEKLGKLGV